MNYKIKYIAIGVISTGALICTINKVIRKKIGKEKIYKYINDLYL